MVGLLPAVAFGRNERTTAKHEPKSKPKEVQLIDYFIIKHGGDCCGCAVSQDVGENEYRIVCNECGQELDVLVSEIAFNRMAEALQRAQYALTITSGLQ